MYKIPGIKIFFFAGYFSLIVFGCHENKFEESGTVHIKRNGNQYQLYRNGQPFTIKGGAGYTHLSRLQAIGGNTIKTWDTLHLQETLDEAHRQGIAVIAGISLPKSKYLEEFYNDSTQTTQQYQAIKKTVKRYKDHPALLMWSLGNEVDFFFHPRYQPFYKYYNKLLGMIHKVDPDHPVTTSLPYFGEKQIINIQWKVPELDVISINIFGELNHFKKGLANFSWIWDGPFIISEWGPNGWWEEEKTAWGGAIEPTTQVKAQQVHQRFINAMPHDNPGYLGSLLFYWGNKFEITPTWFSMFSKNGVASEVIPTIHQLWKDTLLHNKPPSIHYMLIENQGSRENLIFKPERTLNAQIVMERSQNDPEYTRWEILPEVWYKPHQVKRKPEPMENLLISQSTFNVKFKTPSESGPYRLYAYTYGDNGHFSSTNIPFYVLESE